MLSPRATSKNIGLTSRIVPGTLTQLEGDPARLQQIRLLHAQLLVVEQIRFAGELGSGLEAGVFDEGPRTG